MPRFFAQAQLQALADRRKAFAALPDLPMKAASKEQGGSGLSRESAPSGLQGAIAQMESNAAAAMARLKNFRNQGVPSKEELTPTPSSRSEELPESPTIHHPRSDSAPPETGTDSVLASASRLAVLERVTARYLHADEEGIPWHHQLRGTPLEVLSNLLDRPLMLLAAAAACLTVGCWDWLWPFLWSLLSMQKLSTLLGLCCLLLAVSGWLLRAAAFMHAQLSAFADTVPRMPHACEEMSEMLVEMKLMRHDLKSMKAKVAWLPGGE